MKLVQALFLVFGLSIFTLAGFGEESPRIERGNLILENVPDIPAAVAENIRRRQELRSTRYLDWMGDGREMLIGTRVGMVSQIHRLSSPLGARQQLTFTAEPLNSAVARPGGSGFIYTKDNGGDEYYQLYFHDIATGQDLRITDGKRSRNLGAVWSKDGKHLAYLHSPENSNRFQILIASAAALAKPKTILDRDGAFSVEDWSPDGKTLLVSRYVSMNESYMYTLSIADGQLQEINPRLSGLPRIAYNGGQYPQFLGGLTGGPPRGGRFTPDGRSVYFISDQESEFARLWRIDLSTGKRSVVTKDNDWDVEGFDLSPDGSILAYSINENGVSKLHMMDTSSSTALPTPSLPPGVIGNRGFDRQGRRFAFTFAGASGPAEVYVWNIPARSLARWSESETGRIDRAALVQPQIIHFPSFDTRVISAFLYRPQRAGKLPVIIVIHGGPEAQFRPVFSPYGPVTSGLELGFAVIGPNVRGSTGYGKTFVALDNGLKREDALKDLGALLDWIAEQPFLDKDRVVVHGGSYGGYMVNASMVRFAGRLKAGISMVAISDFSSFLGNTAEYRRDLRRAEYGDERSPEIAAFMKRIAPLARANEITAPMFIIHGANDPRVPVTEAERLFAALKTNGAKPWLMIAKDEGHGFQKEANIFRSEEAVTLFLKQVILQE